MDLQAWRQRQQEGEEVILPSGLVVRLVRVSMMDLALRGDIPTPLVAKVNQVLDKGIGGLTVATAPEYEAPINLIVKAAVVEPPVTDEPSATSLGVREIPIIDRMAIFRHCNRYGEDLRPFRREQAAAVESA